MKSVVVKTKGNNDCHECSYVLTCISPCPLKKGYHYVKVED